MPLTLRLGVIAVGVGASARPFLAVELLVRIRGLNIVLAGIAMQRPHTDGSHRCSRDPEGGTQEEY